MDNEVIEEISSSEALYRAQRKALKGKRDNHFAAQANYFLLSEIGKLQQDIKQGTYKPKPYRKKTIYEPKERKIEAPAFKDRVLHHALHYELNKYYERRFIPGSFACREGRGTHAAARYVQHILRSHPKLYVCQIDVSKYYASVNHSKLLEILQKDIKSKKLFNILKTIVDSTDSGTEHDYLFSPDNYYHTKGKRGIPIGNLTSQLFANIYLHQVDMYAKQQLKIRRYVRYMDDILLFHEDKVALNDYKEAVIKFLYEELYLTANPRKVRIYPASQGVQFVGYVIYPFYLRLRGKSVRRMKRRFNRQLNKVLRNKMTEEALEASFNSWKAHAMHGRSDRLVATMRRKKRIYLDFKDYWQKYHLK